MIGDPRSYDRYLESRPPECEAEAIAEAMALATGIGGHIHILHVSSAEAADVLRAAGPGVSAETCPHYLTFTAEQIGSGATEFKCAPPIRAVGHREALWEALIDGTLAMIVSDHSPSPPELKEVDERRLRRGVGRHQLAPDPAPGNVVGGQPPRGIGARTTHRLALHRPGPACRPRWQGGDRGGEGCRFRGLGPGWPHRGDGRRARAPSSAHPLSRACDSGERWRR